MKTKVIDWNDALEMGLIARINKQVLHPLGLSMSLNPDNGASEWIALSDDGAFIYANGADNDKLSDEEIKAMAKELAEG